MLLVRHITPFKLTAFVVATCLIQPLYAFVPLSMLEDFNEAEGYSIDSSIGDYANWIVHRGEASVSGLFSRSGDQSLCISASEVSRKVSEVEYSIPWELKTPVRISLWIKPVAEVSDHSISILGADIGFIRDGNTAEIFVFDASGKGKKGDWLPTGFIFETNGNGQFLDWVQLTVTYDNEAGKWLLLVNHVDYGKTLGATKNTDNPFSCLFYGNEKSDIFIDEFVVEESTYQFSRSDQKLKDKRVEISEVKRKLKKKEKQYEAEELIDFKQWLVDSDPNDLIKNVDDVDLNADFDFDGLSNREEFRMGKIPFIKDRNREGKVHWYGDRKYGKSHNNGLSAFGEQGKVNTAAKYSIKALMNYAKDGDTIILLPGDDPYPSLPKIKGKRIKIVGAGRIVIGTKNSEKQVPQ